VVSTRVVVRAARQTGAASFCPRGIMAPPAVRPRSLPRQQLRGTPQEASQAQRRLRAPSPASLRVRSRLAQIGSKHLHALGLEPQLSEGVDDAVSLCEAALDGLSQRLREEKTRADQLEALLRSQDYIGEKTRSEQLEAALRSQELESVQALDKVARGCADVVLQMVQRLRSIAGSLVLPPSQGRELVEAMSCCDSLLALLENQLCSNGKPRTPDTDTDTLLPSCAGTESFSADSSIDSVEGLSAEIEGSDKKEVIWLPPSRREHKAVAHVGPQRADTCGTLSEPALLVLSALPRTASVPTCCKEDELLARQLLMREPDISSMSPTSSAPMSPVFSSRSTLRAPATVPTTFTTSSPFGRWHHSS